MKISINLALLLVVIFVCSCNPPSNNPSGCGTVTDIDGNVYQTVQIGTQCWMTENLKVTKFRNGDAIPNVTNDTTWFNLTTGAYCDYNNNPANGATYGKLYNWFAVNDSRNIAPVGWHIPTDAEWATLGAYLGDSLVAGEKLKVTASNSPAWDGSNSSGFSALPTGDRQFGFMNIGTATHFWTSTVYPVSGAAWGRFLYSGNPYLQRDGYMNIDGHSVRCVKD